MVPFARDGHNVSMRIDADERAVIFAKAKLRRITFAGIHGKAIVLAEFRDKVERGFDAFAIRGAFSDGLRVIDGFFANEATQSS